MQNAEQLEEQLGHHARHPLRRRTDMVATPLYPYQHDAAADEISLIDLWLVLAKRKAVVAGVLILCVLAAAAAAFLMPREYEVRTGIEIGSRVMGNDIKPVESPDSARAKLENSYIPMIEQRYQAGDESGPHYNVDVTVPRDSNLLILKSTTTEDLSTKYKELHKDVVGELVRDHNLKLAVMKQKLETDLARARLQLNDLQDERTLEAKKTAIRSRLQQAQAELDRLTDPEFVEVRRKALENKIQSERLELASLEDQAQVLKSGQKQIETRAGLLENQIADLSDVIREARTTRRRAVTEVNSETRAMAQLMIDNEIQQNSNRLAMLDERLQVDLLNDQAALAKQIADVERRQAQQRDAIAEAEAELVKFEREHEITVKEKGAVVAELRARYDKMLADHKRAIQEQEQTVAELEGQLENFVATRAVVEPMRSEEPVGTSSRVILLLGAVLGLMLGVFAAFFAEFLGKAREAQRARAA